MKPVIRPIDPASMTAPIRGRNLTHATLGDELGADATALIFLRHFG